jgi:hypothetical protein
MSPMVLYFLGVRPRLADGVCATGTRCLCPARANLQAEVRNGEIVFAGCPVCRREWPCEVTAVGGRADVGFFPPGTVVIA